MNKEIQQLKIERKRYWKKILNCLRGYLRMFKRWVDKPSRNRLFKISMKREKWGKYLEEFLIANQRIKELENS